MASPPRRTFAWCVGSLQTPIELMPDGKVVWKGMEAHGSWAYSFETGCGVFHVWFHHHANENKARPHMLINLPGTALRSLSGPSPWPPRVPRREARPRGASRGCPVPMASPRSLSGPSPWLPRVPPVVVPSCPSGTNSYFMDQGGGWAVYMIPVDPRTHDATLAKIWSLRTRP